MAHEVFISHSSREKAVADEVCAFLENTGIRCWIAPRNIRSGERWPEAIAAAVRKSRIMVLVFSHNANNSKDVANELILAMNANVLVIPFKIDDTEPEGVMEYYLAGARWLDASYPPTREQLKKLGDTVNTFLEAEKASPAASSSEEAAAGGATTETSIHDRAREEEDKQKKSEDRKYKKWSMRFVFVWLLIVALLAYTGLPDDMKDKFNMFIAGLFGEDLLIGDDENNDILMEGARGNSGGNIVNTGLVALEDDWLYFVNNHSGNRIYKAHINDELERSRVNNNASSHINVVGNWIIYLNHDLYERIFKIRTDGSRQTQVTDDHADYLTVADGWIYYINYTHEGRVYRVRPDGSERTRLTFDSAEYLNVVDDWVYFMNHNHQGRIYRVRTDGSEQTPVNEEHSRFINVQDDWIYYTNVWENDYIFKIRTDGSERTRLNSDQSRYLNVVDDWIYYMNFDDGGRLYKIRTDGSEKTRLNYSYSEYINVAGDWICYIDRDHGNALHKIRPDGSGERHF